MVQNARKKANIKNPHTGTYLELDIWMPELKLAFEFQVSPLFLVFLVQLNSFVKDTYHYVTNWRNQIPLDEVRRKDDILFIFEF